MRWSHSLRFTTQWMTLLAGTALVWSVLGTLGLAAATVFAALVVAAICTLSGTGPTRVPRAVGMSAQGVIAVSVGFMVDKHTLATLGSNWIPAVGVCIATLVISIAAGALLGLHRSVDTLTGALSMVAGGAQGLVAMSKELGGDERTVAVIQYVRVALIIVTMPLVATLLFDTVNTNPSPQNYSGSGGAPWYVGFALVVGCIVLGTRLARLAKLPAPAMLGPLTIAGAIELTGWVDTVTVPQLLLPLAFAVIGWQAGLAFTPASMRAIVRVLPIAVILILGVVGACAALGVLLAHATGISLLEGYLATTPGGLSAVLAVSSASGANVTFIAAVQVIRLVIMLFAAPLGARAYLRFMPPPQRSPNVTPAHSD
ncbi:AbrB family transcriptional regulator [Rhodococcus marinonascens]|uniref:AbrB family transcriptional regulator n=1 Tax=Rhodococcus marinonascens TaxID=38311 RepID=UPI00093563CB|nr:AbrB family transcriptional regulator [Rhodococcus marinonascens]